MKQVFERIARWMELRRKQRRELKWARYECALWREARRRIQVREFEGGLCLTYDDIPVALAADMDKDVASVLENARATWVDWKMEDKL